ncbi:MAG: hypothetical protein MUF14_08955 [Hyphomonadaceae bacterium]|jgi:hypothetical protein|nr:hypothetical protein [Hyphomonadaceae bacterium]
MGWWKTDDRHKAGRERVGVRDREGRQTSQHVVELEAEIWDRPGARSRLPELRPRRPILGRGAR